MDRAERIQLERGRRAPARRYLIPLGLGLMVAAASPQTALASFDTDCDLVADELDTYPCDADASATAFAPAQGDHGMLLFEDQFPSQGDFDFNDVAVTYNYVFRLDSAGNVVSFRVTFNTLAVGGTFRNGLGLRLPLGRTEIRRATRTVAGQVTALTPSTIDANATLVISDDLRELFTNPPELINVLPNQPRIVGEVIEVDIELDQPRPMPISDAPYDVFIFRTQDPSIEVHMPEFRGTARMDTSLFNTQDDGSNGIRNYVDTRGIPFGLRFPTVVDYPLEAVSIDQLYPNIVVYGQSGGTQQQDFYSSVVNLAFAYRDNAGLPAPSPGFVATSDLPADTSCVPAWGLAVQWGTRRSLFTYGGALASNGDAILTGYTAGNFPNAFSRGGLDGFVARHDKATGAEIWIAQLGTSGDDTGRDVAVDAAGNIYVVGEQSDQASGIYFRNRLAGITDAFVTKLDPNGNVVWTSTIGGFGNDAAFGVDVDGAGNVYVAGFASDRIQGATDPGGYPSSFLAKYSPSGARQWIRQYRTDPAHPSNYSYNLDLSVDDASGNVYVIGTERRFNRSASAATNPVVTKHRTTDGALMWVNHVGDYGYWNGSLDGRFGYGFGIDVDDFDGAVYITGSFGTGDNVSTWGAWNKALHDDSPDAFFVKLTPAGEVAWSRTLASDGRGQDYAESVYSSGVAGAVYFTGRTNGALPGQQSLGGTDYYLAAFGHDGVQRWVSQGGTPAMDMGHLTASTSCSQTGGVLHTIGNSDVRMGTGLSSWQTSFYRHDIATGSYQGVTLAQQVGWEASPWSACSNTCGEGTMTRTVSCVRPDGTPATDPSECRRTAPPTVTSCVEYSGCGAQWNIGNWSSCTNTCGIGIQTRPVTCQAADGSVQPDVACARRRPSGQQSCGDYSTCTFSWVTSEWGSCEVSNSCGVGSESRNVHCQRSDGCTVADGNCASSRPAAARGCVAPTCVATNTSCASLFANGTTTSGRYTIDPDGPGGSTGLSVYCDMTSHGGGWTNLDFVNDRVWLDASNFIACTGGLQQDANSITCTRPRFDGQEGLPLYQFRCDGSDRSVDYVLDHVAPLLGHRARRLLGFTQLASGQIMGGGASTGGNEYCYAHGVVARIDHLACDEYRVPGNNQQCVPGYFTLRL